MCLQRSATQQDLKKKANLEAVTGVVVLDEAIVQHPAPDSA